MFCFDTPKSQKRQAVAKVVVCVFVYMLPDKKNEEKSWPPGFFCWVQSHINL